MIERYTRPQMAAVWSDEHRLRLILKVEEAVLEAIAGDKGIPPAEIKALKTLSKSPLAERVRAKEAKTGHEVVALLQVVAEEVGRKAPGVARHLHYGLTSSDVLDTVLALQLKESAELLLAGWKPVATALAALARRHAGAWMAGRTHGVHAEPITFGIKLAGWHAEALRNIQRLARARDLIAYGKLSGAVGTYTQLAPAVEDAVCRTLGLESEPVSTQVVPRDRHAEFFHALVLSAAAIERWATEIRHLQRTEVLEVEEPFAQGQKGSSAMPHKKNPVLCENLCGLARLVRAYEAAIVENAVLWHERDISHSSVERVALPDAVILLDFMLHRFAAVLKGLQVHPERMRENLGLTRGLVFSQRVLLKLMDRGLGRLQAYDVVQRNALKAGRSGRDFQEVLAADPAVKRALKPGDLKACFDLKAYGAHVRTILRRAGIL